MIKTERGVHMQSPSNLIDYSTTEKDDWEKSKAWTDQMREVFLSHRSTPRFSIGDEVIVADLKDYKGFELAEVFCITDIDGKWLYREDGNCLPMSCVSNITLSAEQKKGIEQVTAKVLA